MQPQAEYYITRLNMEKHVEGGAFAETYRSHGIIPASALPGPFGGDRSYSTAIYFLLDHPGFSAFHKIASDEIWHFYDGSVLTIYEIDKAGNLIAHKLGRDLEKGEHFQIVIRAGNWFGARCELPETYSLVGCTVAPGFDFADFELANPDQLSKQYPQHEKLIRQMCR